MITDNIPLSVDNRRIMLTSGKNGGIQLVIMVKNGEDTIEQTLQSYMGIVGKITVFDTGSTDQTIKILKTFKKYVPSRMVFNIKKIEWEGFSATRNKCLEITRNQNYIWTLFMDDSYQLINRFKFQEELSKLDNDPNITCVSISVCKRTELSNIVTRSKRIFKRTPGKEFKYVGTIHEDINCNSHYLIKDSYINDLPSDKQMVRSYDRAIDDLKAVCMLSDPRSLYYKSVTLLKLLHEERIGIQDAIDSFEQRANCPSPDKEETFMALLYLGHLYTKKYKLGLYPEGKERAVVNYLLAATTFPGRSGEAYMHIYVVIRSLRILCKAYENRFISGDVRMPYDRNIYSNGENYGTIERYFNYEQKNQMLAELKRKIVCS